MDNKIYNDSFYKEQMDHSYQSGKIISDLIYQLFPNIESVIDVGCGVGTWIKAWEDLFNKYNVKTARLFGVDNNVASRELMQISNEKYMSIDLCSKYSDVLKVIKEKTKINNFDLLQSLEVAEHIEQKYSENFIQLLTSLSKVILFSAAIPYQGGDGHINEQPPQFWVDLFKRHNFICFDILRERIRNNQNIVPCYRQNAMLFIHKDNIADLLEKGFSPTDKPDYYVLPEVLKWRVKHYDKLRLELEKIMNNAKEGMYLG